MDIKSVKTRIIEIPEMRRVKTIHFVGIGGAGMCGIAEVLLNQGYRVTGSDLKGSHVTERLESLGAKIFVGHQAQNVSQASVVVVSSAIDLENPELRAAEEQRIPIVPRAEMLAELMLRLVQSMVLSPDGVMNPADEKSIRNVAELYLRPLLAR